MTTTTAAPAPASPLTAAPAETALADLSVTATSREWLRKLRALSPAIIASPPVPILGCVLVECQGGRATLSGYNYEVSAVAKLQHEPTGPLRNAKALLPASWLARTIRSITRRDADALVTVAAKEMMGQRILTVSAGGWTIPILNHFPLSDFPALPSHAELEKFSMDREILVPALDRALITASKDDMIPILAAMQLEGSGKHLTIRATDRYRLSSESLAVKRPLPDFSFLLKALTWRSMSRHLVGDQVEVGVLVSSDQPGHAGGRNALGLSSGDITYSILSTDGEYPKIGSLFFDEASRWIEVDRRDLLDQTAVALELNERNTPCTFVMTGSSLTVRPSELLHLDTEASTSAINGVATKTPLLEATSAPADEWDETAMCAFNPQYFTEALKAFSSERIRLSLQQSLAKPMAITEAGVACKTKATYRHLVMPVRLPNGWTA